MRLPLLAAAAVAALAAATAHAQPPADDPFAWLETVESPRSLAWVAGQNAATSQRLERDPRYETFRQQALAIFTAKDRIPEPSFLGQGVGNFWQDGEHPRGIWRRAGFEGYAAATTDWETLIDLDALAKAEGRDWIWKGATCLPPEDRYCLVRLSNGGKDAVEIREFDTRDKTFVTGGFHLPEAKQSAEWIDRGTLVVATDWSGTSADLSRSGYPLAVRYLRRGAATPTHDLYRADAADVRAEPLVLRGADHRPAALLVARGVTFFESEYYLLGPAGPALLPLPRKTEVDGLVDGQLVFTIREDWRGHPAGALLAYDLADLRRDPASAVAAPIFQPGSNQAIVSIQRAGDRLIVSLLTDVKGALVSWRHDSSGWSSKGLDLPKDAALTIRAASDDDSRLFATSEGFLDPPTLWLADSLTGSARAVRRLPPRFDASGDVVEQNTATSADGTPIPYFVVRPKAMRFDGSNPVQMFGYGGFEIAETPAYRPEMGKLWLERGGVYVVANIRGGGEFGPRWHEAALREHRQRAFDDFAAVTRDLIARKITSPRHMGIYGRSNGGVLTTVSMTQHPELFNAVVVESPLVDMLRYSHLSAGASWIAEYGDPDVPADRAFIARYSGYQALRAGVKYPEPYVTTNTKDDRVHPGHARKFAAKLESLGDPVLYYENTFGGHANDADPELNARRWARHYVYLSQKLMDH